MHIQNISDKAEFIRCFNCRVKRLDITTQQYAYIGYIKYVQTFINTRWAYILSTWQLIVLYVIRVQFVGYIRRYYVQIGWCQRSQYVFGMERTHLSMWSDGDLRHIKASCKVTINGKQGSFQKAEFADVHMMKWNSKVIIWLLRHSVECLLLRFPSAMIISRAYYKYHTLQ